MTRSGCARAASASTASSSLSQLTVSARRRPPSPQPSPRWGEGIWHQTLPVNDRPYAAAVRRAAPSPRIDFFGRHWRHAGRGHEVGDAEQRLRRLPAFDRVGNRHIRYVGQHSAFPVTSPLRHSRRSPDADHRTRPSPMSSSRQLHLGAFMRPVSIHTGARNYGDSFENRSTSFASCSHDVRRQKVVRIINGVSRLAPLDPPGLLAVSNLQPDRQRDFAPDLQQLPGAGYARRLA